MSQIIYNYNNLNCFAGVFGNVYKGSIVDETFIAAKNLVANIFLNMFCRSIYLMVVFSRELRLIFIFAPEKTKNCIHGPQY